MKNLNLIFVLVFFSSCISGGKENKSDKILVSDTISLVKKQLNENEVEYLNIRDSNINRLEKLRKSEKSDTLNKIDNNVRLDLEKRLHEILKDSRFSGNGKINLETLQGYIGFGMLDGLSFEMDSLKIFYTSKNLFLEYFKKTRILQIENLTPGNLEDICTSAFISDARAYVYTCFKIDSPKNIQKYGMIVGISQGFRNVLPEYIYAFISDDNYVYMIEKQLKAPIKEIPSCKSIYDSINKEADKYYEIYQSSNLKDTAAINKHFKVVEKAAEEYCNCYREKLKAESQFEEIKKQLEKIVNFLEQTNNK